jgi:integrative and conjugative element protein (TIGR02256 family)
MLTFPIGLSGQRIVLMPAAIKHMLSWRQTGRCDREAGGQLFAAFEGCGILVHHATGPRRSDKRCRTSFEPDRKAQQREIMDMYEAGFHFIGDWHTHAEDLPEPSFRDLSSMADMTRRSTHQLNGFVLLIVGRAAPPHGLHMSIHDGESWRQIDANLEKAADRECRSTTDAKEG